VGIIPVIVCRFVLSQGVPESSCSQQEKNAASRYLKPDSRDHHTQILSKQNEAKCQEHIDDRDDKTGIPWNPDPGDRIRHTDAQYIQTDR
jgi:hypothetical protein